MMAIMKTIMMIMIKWGTSRSSSWLMILMMIMRILMMIMMGNLTQFFLDTGSRVTNGCFNSSHQTLSLNIFRLEICWKYIGNMSAKYLHIFIGNVPGKFLLETYMGNIVHILVGNNPKRYFPFPLIEKPPNS